MSHCIKRAGSTTLLFLYYKKHTMFLNYLKTTLRNFKKNKLFSLINIFGLSIGMFCSILIFLTVYDELHYDSFNKNYNNIYRVLQEMPFTNKTTWAINQGPLAPALIEEIPDINQVTRCAYAGWMIKFEEEQVYERGIHVDSSFLSIFTYKLLKGNPETALKEPYSAVITEDLATKIFGNADPMGKVLTIYDEYSVEVTGIMENPPHNSHLKFEFLGTIALAKEFGYTVDYWRNSSFYTYVLLDQNANPTIVDNKIRNVLDNKPTLEEGAKLKLQPLSEIHLSKGIEFENADLGNKSFVVIFFSAAVFILIIACINFMNLTTARSLKRAKEVGLRKVIGATKRQLISQFLMEATIMVLVALIIAIFFIEALLPAFNQFSGKNLSINYLDYKIISAFILLVIVTVLLSGSYPAFFMSKVLPSKIIKGASEYGEGNSKFKKAMVILQFITSILLLIGTYAVFNQVSFLLNKDLGYKKENIVYIPVNQKIRDHFDILKNDLLSYSNILEVSRSASFPTQGYTFSNNLWSWPGKDPNYELLIHCENVDFQYFETFGIDIIDGRSFSKKFPSDSMSIILNETAVELMGIEDPIGQNLLYDSSNTFNIIGVVKDYNFRSLHNKIGPLVLFLDNQYGNYLWMRIKPDDIKQTISFTKDSWEAISPDQPFWYHFLDQELENQYETEKRVGIILSAFSVLAIILLCLGLFGLIGYSITQRYKEISIRKIFGAQTSSILFLFTKEYAKLMLIATVIGIPVINYFIQEWLQSFPYRTEIKYLTFIIPVSALIFVSLAIIIGQSFRATRINAADTLRND